MPFALLITGLALASHGGPRLRSASKWGAHIRYHQARCDRNSTSNGERHKPDSLGRLFIEVMKAQPGIQGLFMDNSETAVEAAALTAFTFTFEPTNLVNDGINRTTLRWIATIPTPYFRKLTYVLQSANVPVICAIAHWPDVGVTCYFGNISVSNITMTDDGPYAPFVPVGNLDFKKEIGTDTYVVVRTCDAEIARTILADLATRNSFDVRWVRLPTAR